MHYFKFTYGLSKYGERCDWEFIEGGAQMMLTGGITGGGEDELWSVDKTCWCCWTWSSCFVFRLDCDDCIVGSWWPVTAVTFAMVVGVTHRFFEFALLEVLSNVLALLVRLSPIIYNKGKF